MLASILVHEFRRAFRLAASSALIGLACSSAGPRQIEEVPAAPDSNSVLAGAGGASEPAATARGGIPRSTVPLQIEGRLLESGTFGSAGAVSSAGASGGGAAGAENVSPPESLCIRADGTLIPYDHSRGISAEFSFELSMDCDVGGFMTPLVERDPVNLTAVDEFVSELTEWLRSTILYCDDTPAKATSNDFLLLPPSPADGISAADFEAVVTLFMQILDRHDGLADGFSRSHKAKIETRLRNLKAEAVTRNTDELTKPSVAPECTDPSPTP